MSAPTESDFSLRPLIAGTLTGLRTFTPDSLGRLNAVKAQFVWRPGENVARCYKARPPQGHTGGTLDCTCGFYAYFDSPRNPYHGPGKIQGLIEGYGTVTVGSRGFRAEKARIQALVLPADEKSGPDKKLTLRERRQHKQSCHSMVHVFDRDASTYTNLARHCSLHHAAASVPVSMLLATARVSRIYPDIPTFPTLAKALKAFPMTPPEPQYAPEPEPLTPDNTPDFWTRELDQ